MAPHVTPWRTPPDHPTSLTPLPPHQAARKRFGIVNTVPHTAFKLVMRKLSSLLPQARTKKEQHLEFCQAMADLKDGRFTVEDKSEIFDLAALAIFKDLQEGLSEAEQEEELVLEEGQLTAQLHHYLPSYWFKALENKKSSMRQQQIEEWDRKVVQSFNELTRSELREDECITEVRARSSPRSACGASRDPRSHPPHSPHLQVRKIVYSFRLETELNALASTRMFIERVRLAPLCFSAQYIAEMWSVDKILKVRASRAPSPRHLTPQSSPPAPSPTSLQVLVVINAGGFHVYRLGGAPLLLSTFNFETLVSWQSMNDMLIINIIYTTKMEATKRREKLRFLTRESMHMKNLLSKYGEVVLQQVVKRMKEREARMRQQEEEDDDDD